MTHDKKEIKTKHLTATRIDILKHSSLTTRNPKASPAPIITKCGYSARISDGDK